MFSYDSLSTIADSYTPLLFIGCIISGVFRFKKNDSAASLKGLAGVLLCYLVMVLDHHFLFWASLGLDYSTHSSVAFALAYFLVHGEWRQGILRFVVAASLLAYYWLEIYQQYHSLADIVMTIIVVWPVIFCAYFLLDTFNVFRAGTGVGFGKGRAIPDDVISESGNG